MVEIPFDIVELIIRTVAEGDRHVLKACSLTCKTFLPLARRYLYSTIDFLGTQGDSDRRKSLTTRFNLLLDLTPEIALLVRAISLRVQESDFVDREVHRLLERLSRVEILFVYSHSFGLAWSAIPDPFHTILVDLVLLSTLTHLTMMSFTEVPMSVLAASIQLEHLTLMDTEFQTFELDTDVLLLDEVPARPAPRLKFLKLGYQNTASMRLLLQPLPSSMQFPFDMTTMETFKARAESLRDMEIIGGILGLAGERFVSLELDVKQDQIYALELASNAGLRSLSIRLHPSEPDEGPPFNPTPAQVKARNTFDLTCVPDLQSLSIRFSHSDHEEDSLYGLIYTLSTASRAPFFHLTSILVEISLDVEGSFQSCWDSDSWRLFDTALSSSGFPALRKVTIRGNFRCSRRSRS